MRNGPTRRVLTSIALAAPMALGVACSSTDTGGNGLLSGSADATTSASGTSINSSAATTTSTSSGAGGSTGASGGGTGAGGATGGGVTSGSGGGASSTSTTGSAGTGGSPGTALIWQTTFDCGDWNQATAIATYDNDTHCDGLTKEGDWGSTLGTNHDGTEITASANHPGGAGKGMRLWRWDNCVLDPTNPGCGFDVNSSGLVVHFPVTTTEYWARFYMRYEQGFRWMNDSVGFTKDIYSLYNTAPNFTIAFVGTNSWGLRVVNPQADFLGQPGWSGIQSGGTATSDGTWHCYEWHVAHGTTSSNGIVEAWADGHLNASSTTADFSSCAGCAAGTWESFVLGENANAPRNGTAMYVDFDDVAVSITGRIGCL